MGFDGYKSLSKTYAEKNKSHIRMETTLHIHA